MRDVIAALARHAAEQPHRTAFADSNETLTWRRLVRRVAAAAEALSLLPPTIGLLADNGIDWAVIDLAATAAGRTLVPLAPMFSEGQLQHAVRAAGVEAILTDRTNLPRARNLGTQVIRLSPGEAGRLPQQAGRARRVIFTSGSTGAPKGVCLGDRQLNTMVRSLAGAIGAEGEDRYLSILPLALLLEQLCAIHVPVLAGGRCDFAPAAAAGAAVGNAGILVEAMERHRPTVSVLVPDLLRAWVGELHRTRRRAPDSLRFVAVGGAPVPAALADAGWAHGIPVHEGYGLSECASVVALNHAGARRAGTVGTPIDGIAVAVEDGEIVVRGPTVMDGYLGGPAAAGLWRTGDLGHLESDGSVVIDGRRDNLLVTAGGRNVQAEWVEGALARDPAIAFAAVIGHGAPALTAVIVPSPEHGGTFADPHQALAAVRAACDDLPAYAVPGTVIVTDLASLAAANLLTSTGRPCRPAMAAQFLSPGEARGTEKERVSA